MIKQKFLLFIIGRKEPLYLSQEEGQKLSIALMKSDLPKFIFLFGDIISVSSIKHLEVKEYHVKDSDCEPLTKSELETLEKYNKIKEELTQETGLKRIN